MKVCTIVGTRPEIIRLSRILPALDECFDHRLIHTGQNWDYELQDIFFEEMELRKPDLQLRTPAAHLGQTIGNIISETYQALSSERPDALLILGDTNSALSAISAKRLKIPVFHMEAGNRCFDENVPEEINRRLVDHISDVNLPYSQSAKQNLIREGFSLDRIFVTGSPLREVFEYHRKKIDESQVLSQLGIKVKEYFVLSCHREENVNSDKSFCQLIETVNAIAAKYKKSIIFSAHPRTRKRIEETSSKLDDLVKISKPFGFFDYNQLQKNAFCVLSDSGSLSEESSILKFPGILIRTSTERPEAIDKGSVIQGGVKKSEVMRAIDILLLMQKRNEELVIPQDYADPCVSKKVIQIISGYTQYINRNVWKKIEEIR